MRTRRVVVSASSAVLLLALTAGCGGDADGADESFTLRVAHGVDTSNPLHEGALRFEEIVERESDGRIKVEIFPASQLGNETQSIEQVQSGDLEMTLASPAALSPYYANAAVFAMPYALEGSNEEERYASLLKVRESDLMQTMETEMAEEASARPVDWSWWYGDRHLTNSVRPIESAADLKGLKIRTPDAEINFLALRLFGVSVVPLAFDELYLALETGTVDGQENPLATIESQKFFEVQDNLALTGHLSQAQVTLFSEDFWQKLTTEDQDMVRAAAQEAGEYQSKLVVEANGSALERLKSNGITVTAPDVGELRSAVSGAAENWATNNDGFDLATWEAFQTAQQ